MMKIKSIEKGFTLLELIVVISVYAILVVASVEIFIMLYNTAVNANSRKDLTQEIRYAVETIEKEAKNSLELNPQANGNDPAVIDLKSKDGYSVSFQCPNCYTAQDNGKILMIKTDPSGNSETIELVSDNVAIKKFSVKQFGDDEDEGTLGTTELKSAHFDLRIESEWKVPDKSGVRPKMTILTAVSRQIYTDYTYCDLFECDSATLFVALDKTTSPNFYSYNTLTKNWTPLPTPIWGGNRQKIVSLTKGDDSFLYAFVMPNKGIMKYDISNNAWSQVYGGFSPSIPENIKPELGYYFNDNLLLFDVENRRYHSVKTGGALNGNFSLPSYLEHGWSPPACTDNQYGDYIAEIGYTVYMTEVCNNHNFGAFYNFTGFYTLSSSPVNTKTIVSDDINNIYAYSNDTKLSVFNGSSWSDLPDDADWYANVGRQFFYSAYANGKIFLAPYFSGYYGIYSYDISENKYSKIPDMPIVGDVIALEAVE